MASAVGMANGEVWVSRQDAGLGRGGIFETATRRDAMRFKEDIKPIADLENKAAHLLRQVNESRRPVVITEGRGLP